MDVSDIFHFFCSGEGKGESKAPGGVGRRFFFIEISGGGAFPGEGVGGGVPGGCLQGIWGGGGNFFFFGAEIPAKFNITSKKVF